MAYEKPGESLETPMRSRSLNIVLGVTEYLFIAGFVMLAVGLFYWFGFSVACTVCGGALVITAWIDAVVD